MKRKRFAKILKKVINVFISTVPEVRLHVVEPLVRINPLSDAYLCSPYVISTNIYTINLPQKGGFNHCEET